MVDISNYGICESTPVQHVVRTSGDVSKAMNRLLGAPNQTCNVQGANFNDRPLQFVSEANSI